MTSVTRLLGASAYRAGISQALALGTEYPQELLDSLAGRTERPSSVDSEGWSSAVKALRATYDIGLREGFDEVREDLQSALELTDGLSEFLNLAIRENVAATSRIYGLHSRDSFLPNVVESSMSLDLQVVSSSFDDEVVEAAPVVTVRFEFDEHIAGQDALTFRMPIRLLSDMPGQINEILDQVGRVSESGLSVRVPDWAKADSNAEEGE